MFQNMCTILRGNTMSNLQTYILMRSCHLQVPWSVAASSLTILFRENFNHDVFEINHTCSTNLLITLNTTCAKFCSSKAQRPYHCSGGLSMAFHNGGMMSIPGKFMRYFWWTKWQWDRFSHNTFGFTCSMIPPVFHTHFLLIYHLCYTIIATVGIIK
jgi:hypothetical protein